MECRKASLVSDRRTRGAEREMCSGCGTERESVRREWTVDVSLLRVCAWMLDTSFERVLCSALEGCPLAGQSFRLPGAGILKVFNRLGKKEEKMRRIVDLHSRYTCAAQLPST